MFSSRARACYAEGMESRSDESFLLEEKYGGIKPADAVWDADIGRLARGEPLAYVIGWIPFLSLKIFLDSHPLIPRPETEWWVEQMILETSALYPIEDLAQPDEASLSKLPAGYYAGLKADIARSSPTFLDLCAGSGAIGCALLKTFPNAQVSFGEIITEHEATIRKNIRENNLNEHRIRVGIGNLFAPFAGQTFDVIATNPPYIPEDRTLETSVGQFEPHTALFAGVDGLALIRRIADDAALYLNPNGMLWLECDSEHAKEALALVKKHAKRAEIRTDQYGRERVIVGYY